MKQEGRRKRMKMVFHSSRIRIDLLEKRTKESSITGSLPNKKMARLSFFNPQI
jgi:hypothetical protein